MTTPFTITPYSGNPILYPSLQLGEDDEYSVPPDAASVTDQWAGKVGSTYYIAYSGVANNPYRYCLCLATAPALNGPWTKQGVILDYDTVSSDLQGISQQSQVAGGVRGMGDPYILHDGTNWHLWFSAIPLSASTNWQTEGERVIAHYTNSASGSSVPRTGWVLENSRAVVALSTGWTSDAAGHPAGVAAPKVHPADGGGYIMYLCNWGYRVPDPIGYAGGYATAPTLNGPWTLASSPIIYSATAGTGYQTEQMAYFKYGVKHYALINRIALSNRTNAFSPGQPHKNDLWSADSQTGPWALVQEAAIPDQSWNMWSGSGYFGIASLVSGINGTPPDLASSSIEGAYAGLGGLPGGFHIGVMTIAATEASPVDIIAPVATVALGTPSGLTAPVTLTANETGCTFVLSENASTPTAGWGAPPISYTFSSGGNKTVYAWAKDAAGNVSSRVSASITVSAAAPPAPQVTAIHIKTSAGIIELAEDSAGAFRIKTSSGVVAIAVNDTGPIRVKTSRGTICLG